MDFGIKGKHAIVCARSKGLEKACAIALAGEGVNVTNVARGKEALEAAGEEICGASAVDVTINNILPGGSATRSNSVNSALASAVPRLPISPVRIF